jgi:hypothetical protein
MGHSSSIFIQHSLVQFFRRSFFSSFKVQISGHWPRSLRSPKIAGEGGPLPRYMYGVPN